MHAERLNYLARQILETYDGQGVIDKLNHLINMINNRISNPNDRNWDERTGEAVKSLLGALGALGIDKLPPVSRKLMSEINLDTLFPDTIRAEIDSAFKNQVVWSDLARDVNALRDRVVNAIQHLRQLREGLVAVGITEDALRPGEIEFDAAMPREAINDRLGGFSKALSQLNIELTVLSRIAEDESSDLRINSISTNDFTVALNINVDLGQIVQCILLGLIYVRLGYRKQIDALKSDTLQALPKELMDQALTWARSTLDADIQKLVDTLPEQAPGSVDRGKLQANRGAVIEAVKYMHDKQELGFNMEVRAGDPVPEEGGDAAEDGAQVVAAIQERNEKIRLISAKAAELKVIKASSTPVLSLPIADEDRPNLANDINGKEA